MGGFENPLLHRLNHHHSTGQRDKGHFGLGDQRHHRHGGARGGATDDDIHLVVVDQALGKAVGLVGIAAVVVMHELQLAAQHAAFFVQVFDVHLQRFQLRVAQKGGWASDRQHGTDLDRIGRHCDHGAHCQSGTDGDLLELKFHGFVS